MPLSKEEYIRYSRHFNLPDFGVSGQEKIRSANVLVVGTGGLGAPLLQYLTAAGVGHIGIVDFDVVDLSNLQRQILFDTGDLGKKKISVASEKLRKLNPHVNITPFHEKLDASNALEIIQPYDVIADGTDNFPTRYLVNDACVLTGKPNVYASIFQYEGQVSVFNMIQKNGQRGPNYRDLFPDPPPPGMVPSCAEGGVLGVLPGIIGSLQANEVLKIIAGMGSTLSGKLLIVDALDMTFRKLNVYADPKNPLTGDKPSINALIDYDEFCGLTGGVASITVHEMRDLKDQGIDFQLIDVREPYEFEEENMGGVLIPLRDLDTNQHLISKTIKVIVHCKSGSRSSQAVTALQKSGFNNVYHLVGGIQEWNRT